MEPCQRAPDRPSRSRWLPSSPVIDLPTATPAPIAARALRVASAAVLAILVCHAAEASAASPQSRRHASTASTSRWWSLDCGQRQPSEATPDSTCVLSVRLHGRLDRSRVRLIEQAIQRRDAAARALGRDVALRVDADSTGGEVFAGMEIGRLLRRAGASLSVGKGAACISACVFALIGAASRSVADGARVGIHRPSLGGPGNDPRVESMSGAIALYADEMKVSRGLIDDMMAVPADRIRFLTPADLARYGIRTAGD